MPNITPTEVAVVCAALVLLYVGPAMFAWVESRRRRRAALAAASALAWRAAATDSGAEFVPVPDVDAQQIQPGVSFGPDAFAAEDAPPASVPASISEQLVPPSARMNGEAAIELHQPESPGRHRFNLGDLAQAKLPDWPPQVVRDDPQRLQAWQEADRVIEHYQATIAGATVLLAHPAQSMCLGSAESEGMIFRLQFLLFPTLWPASAEEAVARVAFEIDTACGDIHARVDPLRPSEAPAVTRDDISGGGEA